MPIVSDCHLHTHHSGDSQAPMEEMILQALRQGLETVCFTEHNDFGFPDTPEGPGSIFLLDTDPYLYELARLREKYADRIRILFGVELGLQPQVAGENAAYAKSHDFDFVIGSSHLCRGRDPYYPAFYEGRDESAAYREYFESILENIRAFSDFDVYGHLDYVVRYGPNKDRKYSYDTYRDILDAVLQALIDGGKGVEINTGGLKSGLREPHPCIAVLKRYRELGGEIVTVGSDAHAPADIAAHFDRAKEALSEAGFRYVAVFEKRCPSFYKV